MTIPSDAASRKRAALTRFALSSITFALLLLAVVELGYGLVGPPNWDAAIGSDLAYYANLARKLFSGGGWYQDRQLHGPYDINFTDEVLYPPAAAWIFAPFMVLPVGVLLALAVGIIVWLILEWRPAAWTWPAIAACIVWPLTL